MTLSQTVSGKPPRSVPRGAIGAWMMFDWAVQPFSTLVTTFVFAPYFAAQVAVNPVAGQAIWGYATAAAGITIALFSPILGAIADAAGNRKPWIAVFSALLFLGAGSLWFAAPGADHAVMIALVGFAIGTVGMEFANVFTNAMMPDLVEESRIGRLSGTGWAVGYVGGLVSLVVMLGFFVANPQSGHTLVGIAPVLGLDPARFEGDRASGPFAAFWFAIFVLPLFLFTPDRPHRNGFSAAVTSGLAGLKATALSLKQHANVGLFLVAHMIYADGLIALFAFGGIYAAGVFGWSSFELGLFGILLTITATIGAVIGGRLDDRFGPKPVIIGALILVTIASIAILSVDRNHVGFFFPVEPARPGGGLFASTGERFYLAIGAIIGALAGPLQSASRSLMVRVAPLDRVTEFFGLYALSGKLTSFAGPLTVGVVTALSQSQRIGLATLVAFFAVGAAVLVRVRPVRHEEAGTQF
jgi:MFS transporter, UMF1 family